MKPPLLTVAFLSWNRLHYLRATVESARRCIRYPAIEWIVSDNESRENGLREYIESLDWVGNKWFRTQTHASAMNEIVARASGKYLLIWPEDVQFVVEGDWMERLIETLEAHPEIGSVGLNFLRRKTYRRLLGPPRFGDLVPALAEWRRRGRGFRVPHTISSPIALRTLGWRVPGVIASGIPSLTPIDHWRKLGPWRTTDATQSNIVDSSLGAEDAMIARFQESGELWQQALLMVPVAADIINDSIGCKAKIRRGKRYGIYSPPNDGPFYYEILQAGTLGSPGGELPLGFEETVRPIGFDLPLDAEGNLLKASINTSVVAEVG